MKHQGQYLTEAARAAVATVSGVFGNDCMEPAAAKDRFLGKNELSYWPSPMAGVRGVEDGHLHH